MVGSLELLTIWNIILIILVRLASSRVPTLKHPNSLIFLKCTFCQIKLKQKAKGDTRILLAMPDFRLGQANEHVIEIDYNP